MNTFKLCRNGPTCQFFIQKRCKFYHPTSNNTSFYRPKVNNRSFVRNSVPLFLYTFSGSQGANPFEIQVVADTEEIARQRILIAIEFASCKKFPNVGHPLPVDLHIGRFCHEIEDFCKPIYTNPKPKNSYDWDSITFADWISIAECSIRPFNLYEVRAYSCLDG